MVVLANLSNMREECPLLNMEEMFLVTGEIGANKAKAKASKEWLPTFCQREKQQLVTKGIDWISLVRIRGEIVDGSEGEGDPLPEYLSQKDVDVKVEGERCPVHQIERVGNWGNKCIIDIVLAIDPTFVRKVGKGGLDEGDGSAVCDNNIVDGWTCEIEFPPCFKPMCYASTDSKYQYLAIFFHSVGLVVVDLAPVSYTILWDFPEPCDVSINSILVSRGIRHKLKIVNAEPDEVQEIVISSQTSNKVGRISTETPPMCEESMLHFYRSRQTRNNTYDLTGLKEKTLKYLRTSRILQSGDRLCMNSTAQGAVSDLDKVAMDDDDDVNKNKVQDKEVEDVVAEEATETLVSVVVSGDTVPLENNMYVIPDFSIDSEQFICLKDPTSHYSHVIKFDKSESYVKYGEELHTYGSKFRIGGAQLTVVKGSIILIISEDSSIPVEFPGGSDGAEKVLNAGDLVVRDLVMRSLTHVVEKDQIGETISTTSFHVYDPSLGTTKECTRLSYSLNEEGDTGCMSIDTLYTNENDEEGVIVNTFRTDPHSTVITSRDEVETIKATFNSDGLSFDSDNGDIYFGAAKDFRIHYAKQDGLDPAMLQIQSLSGTEYLTRLLISADPP